MNKYAKEHIKSFLITFAVAFCMAVVPFINDLTPQTIEAGALGGLIFAGVRAGVKAVIDYFLAWYANRK